MSSQTLRENSQMTSSTVSAVRGPEGLSQAPNNVVAVVQDRVVEPEGGDGEDECGKEPGTHDARGSLLSRGRRIQTPTGLGTASASEALRSRFIRWSHSEPLSLGAVGGGGGHEVAALGS
jgi:hypothetical protein